MEACLLWQLCATDSSGVAACCCIKVPRCCGCVRSLVQFANQRVQITLGCLVMALCCSGCARKSLLFCNSAFADCTGVAASRFLSAAAVVSLCFSTRCPQIFVGLFWSGCNQVPWCCGCLHIICCVATQCAAMCRPLWGGRIKASLLRRLGA